MTRNLRLIAAAGEGAEIAARARLHLSGRAAQFGRSVVGDVSRSLFEDFGRCVERTLAGEGAPGKPRKLRGFALLWRTIVTRLRRR